MPAEPLSLKELFLAALAVPPAERADWLSQSCGQDAELRQRVERMLAAHEEPQSLLDRPEPPAHLAEEAATYDAGPESERSGTIIGPYKLLQQIGEGGFGVVFMAEQQEPVRRKVALKVLKPGMDTRQVVARFEAERQALAIMDHPNIAKVFDGGATASGRPYFVMELVKGVPITQYCDEQKLSPRQRLELFLSVCQAVQHAHQKGIIHRDLKPSNVLVSRHDTTPIVKVIDFGVAKALGQELTDKTCFTEIAQMIGTPLYMSPEQAGMSDLDIDTRSDIYSMGVLLYELLTGTTPFTKERFKKAAYDEIRRIIREEEPPKPSTRLSDSKDSLPSISAQRQTEPAKLTKLVRGELDWIVMKALEKDRNRRYEAANGLAHDIERYLNNEAVLACPPTAGYRLRKFVRRNKGPVVAAALVMLALVSGIVGTTWGMLRAEAARSEAIIARERALAAERAEAERAEGERQAKQQALTYAAAEKKAKESALEREAETKAVLDFVRKRVFAAARPKDQAGGLGYDVKLADALKVALPFIDKSFINRPLIEALLRMEMGESFRYLRDDKTALEQFEKARALYDKHLGSDHPKTLGSMMGLANSYQNLGRMREALKLREEVLELGKAKLGPDHPDTLSSMNNLANSYVDVGRLQEGLKLHEETLKLRRARLGPDHPDTIGSMNNLARSYRLAMRKKEALKLYEEVFHLSKTKLGPDHPDTLGIMGNLATMYLQFGRSSEALKLDEEVLELSKAKLGPDHPDTLASMNNLANAYRTVGRTQEANKLLEEIIPLERAKLGPSHPETLRSMLTLAMSYHDSGRTPEAIKLMEETLRRGTATLGPDHPSMLFRMISLAGFYAAVGRSIDALKLCDEALVLGKARFGPDYPNGFDEMYNIACMHAHLARKASEPGKEADAAMQWLKKLVAAGFKDVAQLKRDTDLNSLRGRDDFKKLLADLETISKKK
jgi:serine/threonine protein kinase/tetratricopeptide (TPR) repeat protein